MPEKVSVLYTAPANGNAEAIDATRRSIASQTYPQALVEVLEVQYVASTPGGHTAALNAARDSATGRYVVQAEPGVVWDSHKLARQVAFLESQPGLAGCAHHITVRNAVGRSRKLGFDTVRTYGWPIACLLAEPWGPGAAMLSKESTDALGAYRSVEEVLWEYALRLVFRGSRLGVMDDDLAVWQTENIPLSNVCPLKSQGMRHRFLDAYLTRAEPAVLFQAHALVSEADGHLVRCGLYLQNDDLAHAHALCQQVGQTTGSAASSYWHGIVHRREPDFDNARGWFQKAGNFAADGALHRAACLELQQAIQMPDFGAARETALQFLRHLQGQNAWDALYFVDLCQQVDQSDSAELRKLLEAVQAAEFRTLFDWTFQKAVGGGM